MGVRQELAAAASAAGVAVSAYYRQDFDPGAGFVRLDRIEYPNPFGGVCHWNVVVMLPQDLADAERFIEQRIPAVRAAAAEVMTVTQIRPEQLQIPNAGVLPCVFINGHREEE